MVKLSSYINNFRGALNNFFRRPVRIVFMLVLFITLIGFSGKKSSNRVVEDIKVELLQTEDNYFLDDVDVLNLITLDGSDWLIGKEIETVAFRNLEKRLEKNPFINRAEIYTDLKGIVNVRTWLKKPVARVIPENGPQFYLCEDQSLMPLSNRYTSRVLLIRGKGTTWLMADDSLKNEFGQSFYHFLDRINEDPFLQAQVAEIEIARDRELTLYPQVTKQFIEFGQLEEIDDKIRRLNIFYKDILPYKGWNSYERVSLKFKNQIVCE